MGYRTINLISTDFSRRQKRQIGDVVSALRFAQAILDRHAVFDDYLWEFASLIYRLSQGEGESEKLQKGDVLYLTWNTLLVYLEQRRRDGERPGEFSPLAANLDRMLEMNMDRLRQQDFMAWEKIRTIRQSCGSWSSEELERQIESAAEICRQEKERRPAAAAKGAAFPPRRIRHKAGMLSAAPGRPFRKSESPLPLIGGFYNRVLRDYLVFRLSEAMEELAEGQKQNKDEEKGWAEKDRKSLAAFYVNALEPAQMVHFAGEGSRVEFAEAAESILRIVNQFDRISPPLSPSTQKGAGEGGAAAPEGLKESIGQLRAWAGAAPWIDMPAGTAAGHAVLRALLRREAAPAIRKVSREVCQEFFEAYERREEQAPQERRREEKIQPEFRDLETAGLLKKDEAAAILASHLRQLTIADGIAGEEWIRFCLRESRVEQALERLIDTGDALWQDEERAEKRRSLENAVAQMIFRMLEGEGGRDAGAASSVRTGVSLPSALRGTTAAVRGGIANEADLNFMLCGQGRLKVLDHMWRQTELILAQRWEAAGPRIAPDRAEGENGVRSEAVAESKRLSKEKETIVQLRMEIQAVREKERQVIPEEEASEFRLLEPWKQGPNSVQRFWQRLNRSQNQSLSQTSFVSLQHQVFPAGSGLNSDQNKQASQGAGQGMESLPVNQMREGAAADRGAVERLNWASGPARPQYPNLFQRLNLYQIPKPGSARFPRQDSAQFLKPNSDQIPKPGSARFPKSDLAQPGAPSYSTNAQYHLASLVAGREINGIMNQIASRSQRRMTGFTVEEILDLGRGQGLTLNRVMDIGTRWIWTVSQPANPMREGAAAERGAVQILNRVSGPARTQDLNLTQYFNLLQFQRPDSSQYPKPNSARRPKPDAARFSKSDSAQFPWVNAVRLPRPDSSQFSRPNALLPPKPNFARFPMPDASKLPKPDSAQFPKSDFAQPETPNRSPKAQYHLASPATEREHGLIMNQIVSRSQRWMTDFNAGEAPDLSRGQWMTLNQAARPEARPIWKRLWKQYSHHGPNTAVSQPANPMREGAAAERGVVQILNRVSGPDQPQGSNSWDLLNLARRQDSNSHQFLNPARLSGLPGLQRLPGFTGIPAWVQSGMFEHSTNRYEIQSRLIRNISQQTIRPTPQLRALGPGPISSDQPPAVFSQSLIHIREKEGWEQHGAERERSALKSREELIQKLETRIRKQEYLSEEDRRHLQELAQRMDAQVKTVEKLTKEQTAPMRSGKDKLDIKMMNQLKTELHMDRLRTGME